MKLYKPFAIIFLSILVIACGSNSDTQKKHFSIKTSENKAKFPIGSTVNASIENKEQLVIDSVSYYLDKNTPTLATNKTYTEKIDDELLGKHTLYATVYYDGKKEVTSKKLTFLNNKAPKLYKYKIIATYPHDQGAFTQGLEFDGDTLYESTGHKGKSSLRKVALTTGEVLQKTDVSKQFFAEGITIMNDKIMQLTWTGNKGFIYDQATLKQTGTFNYSQSKEGWGLCNDGNTIYKSDGSEKIWRLNAKTLAEEDYIQITTNKSVKTRFNELEWVDGKIYANTWQKDGIAIINPKNGALEGVINLSGLREKVTQHEQLDVLNGIAYKADTKQLFVTGKHWDKLFEIVVVE